MSRMFAVTTSDADFDQSHDLRASQQQINSENRDAWAQLHRRTLTEQLGPRARRNSRSVSRQHIKDAAAPGLMEFRMTSRSRCRSHPQAAATNVFSSKVMSTAPAARSQHPSLLPPSPCGSHPQAAATSVFSSKVMSTAPAAGSQHPSLLPPSPCGPGRPFLRPSHVAGRVGAACARGAAAAARICDL